MAKIRFPWHVKVEDGYYAPGQLIEVPNPQDYLAHGAEIVEEDPPVADEAVETRPRRGRRKKEN